MTQTPEGATWAPEARVLLHPGQAFRALADAPAGPWAATRRPFLLLLVLGCLVSALSSGRFAPRLVLDGALSFAFIPLAEVLALAAVLGFSTEPRIRWSRAVDLFCVGNAPWLVWMVLLAMAAAANHGDVVELLRRQR